MRQWKHWSMTASPDVLITSSRLTQLVREVNGTLVVNPGTLTKTTTGGTYAELTIHPFKEGDLRAAVLDKVESVPHNAPARTAVSICKI
jgi:predicted phosphodiesterase